MPPPTIARETATDPALAIQALRVSATVMASARELLAVEEPLEIHLNGWRWLVTMRTPGADADLVLGMLASEGAIANTAEVESIVFRRHPEEPDSANIVDVQLTQPLAQLTRRLARNHAFVSTSCGLCGASSVAAVMQRRPALIPGPLIDAQVIAELPTELATAQPGFQATGGLHAAALFDATGRLLATREDVGRHNAVDKVIGWRLRSDPRPATPILLVSGRASFEIVQKALAAAIPIVAAVSAPSSLAVALAKEAGMTLAGFVRNGGYNLYSGQERVRTVDAGRDPSAPNADPLAFIPRAVRDALDAARRKISLEDWQALTRPERTHLITLSESGDHPVFVAHLVERVIVRTGKAPRTLPPPIGRS